MRRTSGTPRMQLQPGSYPPIVQLVTTVVQISVLLTFSAFGDFGGRRKQLLIALTWVGSIFVMLNIFCFSSSMWWLAGLLRVCSGCCFALCGVYYNSYLPMLAAAHYTTESLEGQELEDKILEVADDMSGKGMMVGYSGGVALLIISGAILWFMECDSGEECSEFSTFFWPAFCIFLVGVWWLVFAQITFLRLKTRPGPEFPKGANPLTLGWIQTFQTAKYIFSRRHTLLFMISFFIYSDAYNAVCTVAPLIMEDELEVKMVGAVINAFLGAIASLAGVFLFLKIQSCFSVSGKGMIIMMLILFACVSLAGGCGIIQAVPGGFYLVLGPALLMLGAIQSYTRSLYASFVPRGQLSAMFAFFAITDKGSNVIGPMVIAIVNNITGCYRGVFWYLLFAFGFAAFLLYFVDAEQGMRDAGKILGEVPEEENDSTEDEIGPSSSGE
mmetsp:Transcript_10185/g.31769  ORF Transcript_10185/g.31769 Transcript_10185/m.31769 type:complete len:442 (+) Transcript_10185:332-1657(+)